MDVSEIRKRLRIAPQEGIAWFFVDEKELAFAPQKTPGRRRVILRAWPQGTPIATVFARSVSSRSGLNHDAHDHADDPEGNASCRIDLRGRIVTGAPLAAKKSILDHTTAMCAEPDPEITRQVMSAPVSR